MNLGPGKAVSAVKLVAVALLVFAVTGCGKKQARVRVPAAPTVTAESRSGSGRTTASNPSGERDGSGEEESVANPDLQIYGHAKPIYVETGVASWYGPPYHNRKAANGEVFDMKDRKSVV